MHAAPPGRCLGHATERTTWQNICLADSSLDHFVQRCNSDHSLLMETRRGVYSTVLGYITIFKLSRPCTLNVSPLLIRQSIIYCAAEELTEISFYITCKESTYLLIKLSFLLFSYPHIQTFFSKCGQNTLVMYGHVSLPCQALS